MTITHRATSIILVSGRIELTWPRLQARRSITRVEQSYLIGSGAMKHFVSLLDSLRPSLTQYLITTQRYGRPRGHAAMLSSMWALSSFPRSGNPRINIRAALSPRTSPAPMARSGPKSHTFQWSPYPSCYRLHLARTASISQSRQLVRLVKTTLTVASSRSSRSELTNPSGFDTLWAFDQASSASCCPILAMHLLPVELGVTARLPALLPPRLSKRVASYGMALQYTSVVRGLLRKGHILHDINNL